MKYKIGDKVRVINKDEPFFYRTGKIVDKTDDNEWRIYFPRLGFHYSYDESDIKPVAKQPKQKVIKNDGKWHSMKNGEEVEINFTPKQKSTGKEEIKCKGATTRFLQMANGTKIAFDLSTRPTLQPIEKINLYNYPENLANRIGNEEIDGNFKLGKEPLEYALLSKLNELCDRINLLSEGREI